MLHIEHFPEQILLNFFTASKLETGSKVAQKATVELIRLFIEHTDIAAQEDKNDFISFEKNFQQVFLYSEGDHIEPCNNVWN